MDIGGDPGGYKRGSWWTWVPIRKVIMVITILINRQIKIKSKYILIT